MRSYTDFVNGFQNTNVHNIVFLILIDIVKFLLLFFLRQVLSKTLKAWYILQLSKNSYYLLLHLKTETFFVKIYTSTSVLLFQ